MKLMFFCKDPKGRVIVEDEVEKSLFRIVEGKEAEETRKRIRVRRAIGDGIVATAFLDEAYYFRLSLDEMKGYEISLWADMFDGEEPGKDIGPAELDKTGTPGFARRLSELGFRSGYDLDTWVDGKYAHHSTSFSLAGREIAFVGTIGLDFRKEGNEQLEVIERGKDGATSKRSPFESSIPVLADSSKTYVDWGWGDVREGALIIPITIEEACLAANGRKTAFLVKGFPPSLMARSLYGAKAGGDKR
jgi:hypothetical protein